MEELEHKSKDLGAVIEYFEPPAVPGFGSSAGFSLRMLDKSNGTDYHEFERVNNDFMAALAERKELTGLFTFYAANFPQYEMIIDNKLAMQKGCPSARLLRTSISYRKYIRTRLHSFGRFFKYSPKQLRSTGRIQRILPHCS